MQWLYGSSHLSSGLSALAESCFQFSPCRCGISYKSGLIHMDFPLSFGSLLSRVFLNLQQNFIALNSFHWFLKQIGLDSFSRNVPLILCHQGQKFMPTLRETKIKLQNLLQYFFVTPNFDLLSIFDYLYFKTFQSPR